MQTPNLPAIRALRPAWNKGRLVGQKRPLKSKHVWAIRVRLELAENHRDLALFNMAIDSKLRGCDLVRMNKPSTWKLAKFGMIVWRGRVMDKAMRGIRPMTKNPKNTVGYCKPPASGQFKPGQSGNPKGVVTLSRRSWMDWLVVME